MLPREPLIQAQLLKLPLSTVMQGMHASTGGDADLQEHVVLSNEVPRHGVQAAPEHHSHQQVHQRLEAPKVEHCPVKAYHQRHIHHVCCACMHTANISTPAQFKLTKRQYINTHILCACLQTPVCASAGRTQTV